MCDWCPLRVYSLSPCAIGARYGYIPSPHVRLVPAMGVFPLPMCDWCQLRVYSLSPCAIGARYGYIPSTHVRLVPATGILSLLMCDWCLLRVYSLYPCAIGARYGCIPSPHVRLVPATSIFPLHMCDWCPLRVYSLCGLCILANARAIRHSMCLEQYSEGVFRLGALIIRPPVVGLEADDKDPGQLGTYTRKCVVSGHYIYVRDLRVSA
eukprot:1182427-Prorocentrum_minimum.AAC.1